MHTNNSFGPRKCRCIPCAQARQSRVEREARIRYREELNETDEKIADARSALTAAEQAMNRAVYAKNTIHDRVRAEMEAEENGN